MRNTHNGIWMRNGKSEIIESLLAEAMSFLAVLFCIGFFAFTPAAQVNGLGGTAAEKQSSHACRNSSDKLSQLIFAEYGAVFASSAVTLPTKCIFTSGEEVDKFQRSLQTDKLTIAGVEIELQSAAIKALKRATETAAAHGLKITPLDGPIAGKRSFEDTERIWNSRFLPALDYWVRRGKISRADAENARNMTTVGQVLRVLEWEEEKMFFSTGKNFPIMSSVAPPGTSQHLLLLAFDIEQASNRTIRQIMNSNGWFQTVVNDSPHFTYLGLAESELSKHGLKAVTKGGHTYWVPAL